ncbi:MAG: hypothetical protein KA747_07470 [Ignavibacteriaceae bacterium]|jgi:hypothetical protein|nr:hypothetical protein [Ignavibacteriaceae bacterium]MBP9122928.1 hypothetical protein [Ignavibacteriaceae bacterium]MCC6637445.1 hypothetical protein [Ignavibacteriaceae bacterium]
MLEYKGGDGQTKETAIKISGVENGNKGIEAEYNYLRLFSEYLEEEIKIVRQTLEHDGDKSYDLFLLQFEDGEQRDLWFDITDFYGNYSIADFHLPADTPEND